MGIIRQQGTRSSLFLLLGFIIGGINTVFLFPKVFSPEEYGLTRALIDTATILSVLATLGTTPVIYKFHPYYRSIRGKQSELPFLTLMVCLAGFILICAVGYFFRDFIIRKLGKSPLFAESFFLVYPFTFFMLLFFWLEGLGWAFKKTSLTNFLKETLVRFLTLLLILSAALGWIDTGTFMHLFSLSYLIPCLILGILLMRSKEWSFHAGISTLTRRMGPKMITFGLYIFGATFLNVAARTADSIMIIGLKGLEQTAVFVIASYLVTFMDLPMRSLHAIAIPVISESWKEKNFANITTIYHKSTVTLLIAGLAVYLLALLNADNLVLFLGAPYAAVPSIILIMGAAKLIDMGTGVNGQIIATSLHWKFDFYTNVLLTLLSFPLNFLLIREWGIIGAAFANLMALFIFNLVRFLFLYFKYGWQPYRMKHLLILLLAGLSFLGGYALPKMDHFYVDSLVRSTAFLLLFVPALLLTKVSEDLNDMTRRYADPRRWFR